MKSKHNKTEEFVTVAKLRSIFECNTATGKLYWKARPVRSWHDKTWNTRFATKEVGNMNTSGYLQIAFTLDGVKYYSTVHRIIWALANGHWPDGQIDHVKGDGRDNRLSAMRVCEHSRNMMNKKVYRNNTSGFKGVSLNKRTGLWMAQIGHDGKVVKLGEFSEAKTAALVYDKAAVARFGEYARTNKSMGLV